MRQNFSTWSKRSLSIENLKLDINNPRFSYQTAKKMNQTEIVRYLIEKYEVYELAKDIATNGYLIGEEPYVCKEGDSFTVLEGNRRMAACKILLNPSKYLSSQKAQIIQNLNYKLEKIECYISPSRKDADVLIYRRHNGIPLKKWNKICQDAYFYNLYSVSKISIDRISKDLGISQSQVRKALRRYHAHQYAIKLFKGSPLFEQIAQDDFPITNLERFYDTEDGATFLGISFLATGQIRRKLLQTEFDIRFKYIIEDILNDNLNSRNYNGEKEQKEYITILENKKDKFDFSSKLSENPEEIVLPSPEKETDENNQEGESDKTTKNKANNVIRLFGERNWITGNKRIDAIFQSLQKVNHKTNLDMVAISFRCYLDMIIYEYLEKMEALKIVTEKENDSINKENQKQYAKAKSYIMNKFAVSEDDIDDEELQRTIKMFPKRDTNFSPSLHKMLTHIASNPELLPDSRQREALAQFMKGDDTPFLTLKSFNLLIHNQNYNISLEQLHVVVINLVPLLCHINKVLGSE